MTKNDKILIAIIIIWIAIAGIWGYRLLGNSNFDISDKNVNNVNVSKKVENVVAKQELQKSVKAEEKKTEKLGVQGISIVRPDIFNPLYDFQAEKKLEAERKKIATLPAPPMPFLPDNKNAKAEQTDLLKDVAFFGLLHKTDKKMAFFKKGKEIKSYEEGSNVFETGFFIDKIEDNEVILKSKKGEKRVLELDKEVKNGKK